MKILKNFIYRLRGEVTTEQLIRDGMRVGKNFHRLNNVILDPGHCWLISIGNNVTMAPRVHVLCHDASTKLFLDYAKIGRVTIGDNVFVGAGTVILPGVTIGSNVVIGANSTVTHDIPDNSLVAGNPARRLSSLDDYLDRMRTLLTSAPCFDETYTVRGGITDRKMEEQRKVLETHRIGFVK